MAKPSATKSKPRKRHSQALFYGVCLPTDFDSFLIFMTRGTSMSKYAQAAVATVRRNQGVSSPNMRHEWDKTMGEYFPTQKSSRSKSCPRSAFLGLCEEGLVVGIPAGDYGLKNGNVNKQYVINAMTILQSGGEPDKAKLWGAVTDVKKAPNHQMDIVLALLKQGMLREQK